jgi:PAS domain S-box-containing protein
MDDKMERLAEKLAIVELRFNYLAKNITTAIWDMEVDPQDPTGEGNAFWWSPEFRQMLGYEDEHDFPNVLHSWSDKLHPDDKQRTLEAFAAHMKDATGKTPYDVIYKVKHKKGHYLLIKASGETLRAEDGTPIRVFGTAEDITRDTEFSGKIKRTLHNIEGIVKETQIVAMMSKVEAARAGLDGAGFKVLADRIHGLSVRIGAEAIEIEKMLDNVKHIS